MARAAGVPSWQPSIEIGGKPIRVVLEGGSIDANGRGTMLTTEECLLSEVQQRNPGLSRTDMEGVFAKYLGVSKVIWLNKGIAGDDTHGHVDYLARFVAPDTIVTVIEADRADENYELLQENLELLRNATDQDGQPLKVATLQMPAAGHHQRPACAGELCQFLHRERLGSGSHIQRSKRSRCFEHSG